MDALSELRYAVELPLTPAPEFSAVSVERIEDAFDEDFVDYIFSDRREDLWRGYERDAVRYVYRDGDHG